MNVIPSKNEIVIFRKRSEPSLGVLIELGAEEMRVYSEEGRELSLDRSKLLFGSGIFSDQSLDENQKKLALRELRRELEKARESLDLGPLWECVYDDSESVDFVDLMELHFGPKERDEKEELTFFWALDKNNLYFKRLTDGYGPRTPEDVDSIKKRNESERLRKLERLAAISWTRAVIEDREPERTEFDFQKYIELVRNYVIYLDKMENAPWARSFMSEAGIKNTEEAIQFLIKAGHWKEEDDPAFLRLGISTSFPKKAAEQAQMIIDKPLGFDGCVDLTSLEIFSIDDEDTPDIDDAISITPGSKGPMLGIHISDVAGFIGKNTPLDSEALGRGETIYLPEGHVHMFPPELMEKRLSLFAGEPRRALSLLVNFDEELRIVSFNFVSSKIKVKKNLSYSEAEEILKSKPCGNELFEITRLLRQERINSGGFILDLPDLKIDILPDGETRVWKSYMSSPAHEMVAECMILMNNLAGKFLKENEVPAIYRTLTEEISEDAFELDPNNPLYPQLIIRYLRPSKISTVPLPHNFLGVDAYVQVTSPIRRYIDLIIQRQIINHVRGLGSAYKIGELESIYRRVVVETKDKKMVERMRTRFWLCKHLEKKLGDKVLGIVSGVDERAVSVYLVDYMLELKLPVDSEDYVLPKDLAVGAPLEVVISKVNPIKRSIVVVPASMQ